MHILIFAGTRPEAIKTAPVVHYLREKTDFKITLVASGQHREMLIQAFSDFSLTPDYNLDVMQEGQTLAGLSSCLFNSIDALLDVTRPDWILVQGDTTTVMVAAQSAFYRNIKIGHIEAGLRSFNIKSPFPEEMNRRVASIVSDLHFAPTAGAKNNLLREYIPEKNIIVTGNTVIDALLWIRKFGGANENALPATVLRRIKNQEKLILITGHRRENQDEGLDLICKAILELAKQPGMAFIFPVHLNPKVRNKVFSMLGGHKSIDLLEPLPYKEFVALMAASYIILTDSGGIQEEAPALNKPVLVMREVTERPEGIDSGSARLVGTQTDSIVHAVRELMTSPEAYAKMATAVNPYGDGRASERIVCALSERM